MMKSVLQGKAGSYRVQYDLGRGQQGTVFCGQNIQTGQHYAIKLISLSQLPSREAIEKEISIHKRMAHPNVIKYVESFTSDNNLVVVMELGECSLSNYIDSRQDKSLSQMELIAMLKDLTHGISYIHSNGVIHRDIKIDNVILKHNVCKITDFGVSSVGEISQTFVGTPVYLAPEIMNNRVYNDAYDKTVDIWALGVLAFEAYFRINPFFYHGSRLMTFSDFEVITDNIMNICIPEFDIKNVIKMIRKENMEKEANFIVKKLQKTSKHLIFLFKKFFEFEPQKRAKTQTVLQLLSVMEQPDLLTRVHEEPGNSMYYSDRSLSEDNSSMSSSIKSDQGFAPKGHNPNAFLTKKTKSMNDATTISSRTFLIEKAKESGLEINPKGSISSISSSGIPEAQLPQYLQSLQIPTYNQKISEKANPMSSVLQSVPGQPQHLSSGIKVPPPMLKPSASLNQSMPTLARRPSLPDELVFLISTRKAICELYADKLEAIRSLIGALEALISFRQEELGNSSGSFEYLYPQQIERIKSLDLTARRNLLKTTIYTYFRDLNQYIGKSQPINECLFRLIVCSAFGEIVANLKSFMEYFRLLFGGRIGVMELERFAPYCTAEQVGSFANYITKCFNA